LRTDWYAAISEPAVALVARALRRNAGVATAVEVVRHPAGIAL
jgi:hypothetical protein